MLKYNLIRSVKNLLRFKSHQVIGISGLVVGISCVFIISAWVMQELEFDSFHDQSESIFMVTTDIKNQNGVNRFPETPPPLAAGLKERIPEIENSTHFIYLYGGRWLASDHTKFREVGIAADIHFFDVFSFEFIIGTPNSLSEPGTIFLTENLANKFFPDQDPIGKSIVYNNGKNLLVKGILKDVPENSSLKFDYVIPYQLENDNPDKWWQLSDATFIKTTDYAGFDKVKNLGQNVFSQHITDDQYSLNLIPITELRYSSDFNYFNAEHGDIQKLLTLSSVALLILLLTCLNYTNLLAAYSYKRKTEVMVRKVNGSNSIQLVSFFLTETVITSVLVWVIAVVLSGVFTQIFQSIMDVSIAKFYIYKSIAIGLPISILLIGLLSGIFPAILANSLWAIRDGTIKGLTFLSSRKLRDAFLLSQFVLSITLTLSCLVILKQINYMKNYDVGYSRDDIIQVDLTNDLQGKFQTIKYDLLVDPDIQDVSFAGASPINWTTLFTTENWHWEGLRENAHISIYRLYTDEQYLSVFGLKLKEGQFFLPDGTNENKVVINEIFADLLAFEDPVGHTLMHGEKQYEILGVVKNFNFQHLSSPIKPMAMMYSKSKNKMFIKTNHDSRDEMSKITEIIRGYSDNVLTYSTIVDKYDEMYGNETRMAQAMISFTLITILLSCIGMIGIITFSIELRTKEIAVRKVNGAKVGEIMFLLNKGTLKWFVFGGILSCCIIWFGMHKWLDNFAFKVTIDWWIYFVGIILVFIVNVLTVSIQSWTAAKRNPVKSLRYE